MVKSKKLLGFLRVILDLAYGAFVIASFLLFLWILLSPLIVKLGGDGIVISASVPVAIGSGEEPQFGVEIGGSVVREIRSVFVDDAQGTLRLETTNWYFIFISNFAKLLTAIGLAYVFYLLRSVIQALIEREIFTPENSKRLRRLGYVVLLLGFLRPTVEYIAASEILNQLTVIEPALSLPSPFKVEVILASLLILIIAQVWNYGLELELDQELTV
jgi:hypothetical protein